MQQRENTAPAPFHASQWQVIFDALPACVVIGSALRDGSGRMVDLVIEYLNDTACVVLGGARERLVGRRLGELLPGDRTSGFLAACCRVADGAADKVRNVVEHAVRSGGRVEVRRFAIDIVRHNDGVLTTWIDVTTPVGAGPAALEPRDVESSDGSALERAVATTIAGAAPRAKSEGVSGVGSDTAFRAFADASPVLIWMSDDNQEGIYFNDAWLAFTGVPFEQQRGRGWRTLVHPDDLSSFADACNRAFQARRPFTTEFRLRRADGEYRWLLDSGTPRFDPDGSFVGFVGSCVDITDRKHAEQRIATLTDDLRQRAEELDAILRVLPVGIFVAHDAECRQMTMNPAGAAMLGLDERVNPSKTGPARDALTFRVLRDGMEVPSEELPMQRAARSGRPVSGEDFEIVFPDGTARSLFEYAVPLFSADGQVRGCIGAFVDLTERKQAEAELREREERFERLVQALPAAVYTTDAAGQIDLVNDGAIELWGRRPEPGERWCGSYRLFDLDGRPIPHHECPMALVLRHGEQSPPRELLIERPDGTRRHVLVHPEPLYQGDRLVGAVNMAVDLTEPRRAEETRAILAAIVESSDDAIVSKTLDGIIQSWNDGACRLFGYTAEEAIGKSIALIVPPELMDEERTILDRLGRGEPIDHFETQRVAKDGTRREISLTISPIRDRHGRVIGASKVARDIRERRRAERALQASENRFRRLADSAPVLIWICDRDGNGTWFNRPRLDLVGRTLQEELGTGWLDRIHPEDRDRYREELVEACRACREVVLEYRLLRHDGAYRWMLDHGVPLTDANGNFEGYIGSGIDITDRRRMEDELRISESRFRTLANAVPALVWATRPDGSFFYLNPRWEEFTGQPTALALGDGWTSAVHPTERQALLEKWKHCVESGETFEGECRYRHQGGEYRRHYFRALPVRDNDGQPLAWYGTSIDIEDRKRIEDALHESESRFRNIADSSPMMIWVTAVDGRCTYLNRGWYDFTGQDESGALGFGWLEAIHPGDRERVREHTLQATTLRQPFRVEYRLRRADGAYRWCIDAATPRFSDSGLFLGFVGSVIDITERKTIEDALRDSEERFRTLAENISQFAWMADSSGSVFWFNQRWYDFTGTTLEEMQGWGWTRVLHPDHVDRVVESIRRSWNSGEPWEDLYPMRGRDGGYRWFLSRAHPIRDVEGHVVRWFGTNTDVTEHRATQEALRESELRLRLALRGASAGVWSVNIRTGETFWSDELLPLYGLDPSTPRSLRYLLDRVHPEDRERVEAGFRRHLEADDEEFRQEFRIVHPDRGERWILDMGRVERDGRNVPVRCSGINIDITDRKRHEEQLRTVMAELNHRVKNTLAVVQSISTQTMRRAADLPSFRSSFEKRLRAIAAAHSLLTNGDWEGASLQEIISTELDAASGLREQRTIQGPPIVLRPKEALAMHMVVHELTTNACKYGALSVDTGRVSVEWEVCNGPVRTFSLVWHEQCGRPVMRPTGIGYGTRLMEQLVEYELKGTIEREFRPQGIHCRIAFPLGAGGDTATVARARADARGAGPTSPAVQQGGRVLVVEDNAALAMGLTDELEDQGFTIVGPAGSLERAMELARTQAIDVAVVDVDLGGTPSYPLARLLRDNGVPFALLTGYTAADLPDDLPATTVMSKPVALDELIAFLQRHCQPGDSDQGTGRSGSPSAICYRAEASTDEHGQSSTQGC